MCGKKESNSFLFSISFDPSTYNELFEMHLCVLLLIPFLQTNAESINGFRTKVRIVMGNEKGITMMKLLLIC